MRLHPSDGIDAQALARHLRARLQARAPSLDAAAGVPAAVLVPLLPVEGAWHVLFTVRPRSMPSHAGEVCFPGGRLQEGEDARAAALREAWEEVGLAADDVNPLGFSDLRRTGSGHVIAPLVGVVRAGWQPRPCAREVAAVFTAPLAHFLDADHYAWQEMVVNGRRRAYPVLWWRQWRIWGATAAILWRLRQRLA